ncbi:MAG: hypothetical protein SF028_11260 [Candidatus Sumerlaeia bacterium]|nr:hypothetical protein [Candidatus Sumerlaeia bacterium]
MRHCAEAADSGPEDRRAGAATADRHAGSEAFVAADKVIDY